MHNLAKDLLSNKPQLDAKLSDSKMAAMRWPLEIGRQCQTANEWETRVVEWLRTVMVTEILVHQLKELLNFSES